MADDLLIISSIYDAIDTDPLNVDLHERLLEIWEARDDADMARPVAEHILTLDPTNKMAKAFTLKTKGSKISAEFKKTKSSNAGTSFTIPVAPHWTKRREFNFYPEVKSAYTNQQDAEKVLEEGLKDLLIESKLLHCEISALSQANNTPRNGNDDALYNLHAISEGRIHLAVPLLTPASVREVSRDILATSSTEEATSLITSDFESLVQWFEARHSLSTSSSAASSSTANNDTSALRSRLVSRKTMLLSMLPDSMEVAINDAFTHIERTHLNRTYANNETMLGDALSDIPQSHFFVSEDNYAWDISELIQAITANSGVMRNPLTRTMFTPSDIKRILAHPLGSTLKPLRSRQERFEANLKGAHVDTIRKITDLAKVMLADQSADAAPSRQAMDEFVGYVATLPKKEQEALSELKIPAKDRHTGQAYDYTVGEAVRDAQANVTCSHKVGDFLDQAAKYLEFTTRDV